MEECARANEAPLSPERNINYILSNVHGDLLARVRSLHFSRNHKHPPRTPYSSIDLTYSPHDPGENQASFVRISPNSYQFCAAKAIAKLAYLESIEPKMVANNFDGPSGRIEDANVVGPRRPPSQPEICFDSSPRSEEKAVLSIPGLNQLTFGGHIGREYHRPADLPLVQNSVSQGPAKPSLKLPSGPPSLKFNLRMIPPSKVQSTDKQSRPVSQHVPGSYRSEVNSVSTSSSKTPTPSIASRSAIEDRESKEPHSHPASSAEFRLSAMEALKNANTQDLPVSVKTSILATHPKPCLRGRASQATLKSTKFTRPAPKLLVKSHNTVGESKAVEPQAIAATDDSYISRDASAYQSPAPGSGRSVQDSEKQERLTIDRGTIDSSIDDDLDFHSHKLIVHPDEVQISELLAGLPSVTQNTVDALDTAKPVTVASDPARKKQIDELILPDAGHQASSEYTFVPLENVELAGSLRPSKAEANSTQVEASPLQDTDVVSVMSRKLSFIGKALSSLSDVSLHSNFRALSSHSSAVGGKDDHADKASYSQMHPSSRSASDSNSSIDAARLIHLSPRPTMGMPDESFRSQAESVSNAESDSRKHWIRNLLTRRSATPVAQSNLTARPYYRETHAVEAANAADRPKIGSRQVERESRLMSDDSAQHRDASPDDSLIRLQQQQNTESFSKVIVDLEALLKEALQIAHLAAEKDVSNAGLEHSKDPDNSSRYSIEGSGGSSLRSRHHDEEDNCTTLPPQHADIHKLRATFVEPDQEALYQGNFRKARNDTPYPAVWAGQTSTSSDKPSVRMSDKSSSLLPPIRDASSATPWDSREQLPSSEVPDMSQKHHAHDWAVAKQPPQAVKRYHTTSDFLALPQVPISLQAPTSEQHKFLIREHNLPPSFASKNNVHQHILAHQAPPIQPRTSSVRLRPQRSWSEDVDSLKTDKTGSSDRSSDSDLYMTESHAPGLKGHTATHYSLANETEGEPSLIPDPRPIRRDTIAPLRETTTQGSESGRQEQGSIKKGYSLRDRHHFSIREPKGFSLSRSHRRAPIARDWSTTRKRYIATIACISTALMGLIIGIYAGEVPAIQYAIVDEHHYTILGNVVFFIGLAITTALFWPLPLLHGRKPYTLAALAILLPLQFPQALSVNSSRSPYVATYRVGLLLSRAFAGVVMGFANINFKTTLLDLFGASLQSVHPHQETVNVNDVRRHGGGMGLWLGIWTWCSIGSIGVGFLIGALIISGLDVSWGFWITIILTAFVLVLNVVAPEVRRSPYRRSMAEVRSGTDVSRRVARGEIKMHLEATGPIWWWEEVIAGHVLCIRMLKQPGFVILSLYQGWIYGQIVMVIVLLGALLSKYYNFRPQYVGACVLAIPIGALLAIPFQKASLFSRSRKVAPRTDSMTFEKRVTWTSHLVRRAIFMILLPFAGLAYTLASRGPSTHYMVPTIFAGVIGFLSNLAIAECNGIIMETYDTSDLQPGMTGRPRNVLPEEVRRKRTNFSCFPRVSAAFAIAQTFAFLIAAAGTGAGGAVERRIGAQTATAVVASVLLVLTLLLIAVLTRFKEVQIIPSQRYGTNILSGPEDEWKPIIIGSPSGTTRRMSLLELGKLSRWSEIRRRNKVMEPAEN